MFTRLELQEHPFETLRAWFVHLYTGLGLPLAFAMLVSTYEGRPRDMFLFMLAAFVVDGTDGPMARRFNVKKWAPRFDGRKLDDIIDYLVYVFIPVFFMYRFNVVNGGWTIALVMALLASGYGFCSEAAKTEDKYFTGFPSYWNAVAFFLYLLNLPIAINGLIVAILAILVFVPAKYDSTQVMGKFEKLVILPLMVLGTAYLLFFRFDQPLQLLVYALLIYPIYHIAHALAAYVRKSSH